MPGRGCWAPYISQCLPCLLSLALHVLFCSQSCKLHRSSLLSLFLSLVPSNSFHQHSLSSSAVARDHVSGFAPLNRHSKGELRRSRATDCNTSSPIKLPRNLRVTNDKTRRCGSARIQRGVGGIKR